MASKHSNPTPGPKPTSANPTGPERGAPSPSLPRLLRNALDLNAQYRLLRAIDSGLGQAPLFQPSMPRSGRPFSVKMSNFGPLGWVSDRHGYRYQTLHPITNRPWPSLPDILLEIWSRVSGYPAPPECALINYYSRGARMGLHQDRDEANREAPVVSISLGDRCQFRIATATARSPATRLALESGDIIILEGATRFAFHGVSKIDFGSSQLLAEYPALFPEGGRVNITMRRVTPASPVSPDAD